jgi:preprotein translocase SecE subunit
VPAALEHASGEVEEFDAAMARGAAEVFSDDDQDATTALQAGEATNGEVLDAPADTDPGLEDLVDEGPSPSADADADDYEDDDDQDADGSGTAVEAFAQRDEDAPAQRRPRRARAEVSERKLSLPARAAAFLRASWAELQRMQWPDRQQTSQATAVVLGFVVVAGLYLGAADWVAQKVVNLILE